MRPFKEMNVDTKLKADKSNRSITPVDSADRALLD